MSCTHPSYALSGALPPLLDFLFLFLFVLDDQVSQVTNKLICLLQKVCQTLVFLLINQLAIAFLIFSLYYYVRLHCELVYITVLSLSLSPPSLTYHQPPHPFLLQELLLLSLFPFNHGVVAEDSLTQPRHLTLVVAMEFLEVSSMLKNTVQILLKRKKRTDLITVPSTHP